MIAALQRFAQALREEGARLSPAEWLDALRAVEAIPLEQRSAVRAALAATLVKRRADRARFDRVFDRLFAASLSAPRPRRRRRKGGPGEAGEAPPRGRGEQGGGPSREASQEPSERALRQWRTGERGLAGRIGSLRKVVLQPATAQRPRLDPTRPRAHTELRRRMSGEEEARLAAEARRQIERLRHRPSRRQRRARRGPIALRRLYRSNLGTGGVPWLLPRRRPRRRAADVVLLVDVSWSTARAAALFLTLTGELLARSRRTRVLFFVDRPVEAGAELRRWLAAPEGGTGSDALARKPSGGIRRGGISFAELVDALPGLNPNAPSDYGRTFDRFNARCGAGRGRDVLLVLGDARNNRLPTQAWALEELRRRFARVLWLLPEPVESWGTGDSAIGDYLPFVDALIEARDVGGLAHAVRELQRAAGR